MEVEHDGALAPDFRELHLSALRVPHEQVDSRSFQSFECHPVISF
jgi:hypothetical protein